MYKFELCTLNDYISAKNVKDGNLCKNDFLDANCTLCHSHGISFVAYGDKFGTEFYCEDCFNKIKEFMNTIQ